MLTIPFENIDVRRGTRFTLEPEAIFRKVVVNKRGGFCYELNKLFYYLLRDTGFEVHTIAARIFDEQGNEGPPFDHMALIVTTDKTWLVDVGFGDLFIEPRELKVGVNQPDRENQFRIEPLGNRYMLLMTDHNGAFTKKYSFDVRPRSFADFEEMSLWKQTNPESWFVKNFVCTQATSTGRITIINNKFRTIVNGELTEVSIRDEHHCQQILAEKFNITT